MKEACFEPRPTSNIERHIDELLTLGVIRNLYEDEQVDITTPLTIAGTMERQDSVETSER